MATKSKKYYDTVLQTATKSGASALQAKQAAEEAVNKKYGGLTTSSPLAPASNNTASKTNTSTKAANSPYTNTRPTYTQSQNVTNAYNRVNSLTNSKPLSYTQSQAVSDAYNKLTALDGSKPNPYTSNYSEQINSLLNEITNRDKFTYNADNDPLYNQYKDTYTSMGKQAMQDTMGNAAALTGGYGSSYASTAGNQAYQAYLGQLNDKLPELYQLALDKYNNETSDMYNRMSLLQGLESTDYGRYRDTVSDYYNDVSNAENRYNMLFNQDYGKYRDNMSDYYTDLSNATDRYNMLYNQDYGQYRDNVSDWENDRNYNRDVYESDRNFDYQKEQDALSQQNWEKQFDYGKQQDALSQQNWEKQFDYGKQQDALSQQNWEKQYDRSVYESDRDYDRNVYENDRAYNQSVNESNLDYQLAISKLEAAKDTEKNLVDGKEATKTVNEMFERYDNMTGEKYYSPLEIALTVYQEYSDCDNFTEWSSTYKIPGSDVTIGDVLEEYLKNDGKGTGKGLFSSNNFPSSRSLVSTK